MKLITPKRIIIPLAIILLVQNNCVFFDNGAELPGGTEYREITRIPNNKDSERKALFNSYPVEKQIDIYLFAMIHRAPADVVFREYLKEDGEDKIPKLVEAIEKINSPMAKGYLIGAIGEIDRYCNCVANDTLVLERLKLAEPLPAPQDDKGDAGWKRNYSSVLFELQRKSPDKKNNPEIQNMPNPYSNSYTNQLR